MNKSLLFRNWRPFIEWNGARDEWQGQAWGLFTPSGYCLLGLLVKPIRPFAHKPSHYWGAQVALIAANVAVGLWQELD